MIIKNILKKHFFTYRLGMTLLEKYYYLRWKLAEAKIFGDKESLIAKEYKKNTGETMHFPPISYTEKMQFSKIYNATEEKGRLSDKIAVRDWVNTIDISNN